MCEQCQAKAEQDDTRWLALLIRQGLKLIVVGIEKRYGLGEEARESAKLKREKAA